MPVHINKLDLVNFRGFAGEHSVLFPEGNLAVLVGENGVGKTTVLEALAGLLSVIPFMLRGHSVGVPFRAEANVNVAAEVATHRLGLSMGDFQAAWWFTHTLGAPIAPFDPIDSPVVQAFANLGASLSDPASILPVVTFIHSGSTRTPMPHTEARTTGADHPRLAAYEGSFDPENLQFDALESWFESQENLENEQRLRKNNLGFRLPALRAVRGAVTRFLTELQARTLHNLQVVRTQVGGPLGTVKGRLAIQKGESTLFLDQLSDGERRLVLLVGDVARRLAIANPDRPEPLDGPGVVLVDEIDLHLHPRWQRRVIDALMKTFPGLQWIMTTHAPAVLSTVPNHSLVVLTETGVVAGERRVKDRDSNTILADLMGVPERPEGITERLGTLYAAIDQNPRKARKYLKDLEAELGADDPELVRARTILALTA